MIFARLREELCSLLAKELKALNIIPSPQLVPLLFANSDSAKEVSHDTPVGSKSFIDKIRAFSATLQIDHKAHACSCGPSCCLSTHRNIIDLPTSLAFLGGSTQRCRARGLECKDSTSFWIFFCPVVNCKLVFQIENYSYIEGGRFENANSNLPTTCT